MNSKLNSILVIAVILLTTLEPQAQVTNFDKQNNDTLYNVQSKIIVVPERKSKQVVTDGMFSIGEWDDALSYSVADNYNIYLKAGSEILYIGLKSVEPIGECITEIRITSDEKEVFLLHVSGCLGEGISGFPATTKFDLNNNQYWEANFLSADSLKRAAWFAAGQPVDKYADMYEKRDGIEFKICRNKFTGNSLKFTIGWITIEVKGNEYHKNVYNYPESASLKNADNWVELILPATEGPYLGQKPPGMTPEIFAPGIVSTEHHEFGITFSKGGKEMFFTRRKDQKTGNRILHTKIEGGRWSIPHPPTFALDCREFEPNFAPDGIRLFYNSSRPLPENVNSPHPFNQWVVYKQGSDWTGPEMIGSPILELFPMFATQSKDGTLYFTGNIERGIYCAEYRKGHFENPERLPDVINSINWAGHPFIDPEERYIIFDSNVDEKGKKNLYISFKDSNGEWTESININQSIGFSEHAAIPHVSFDGKYLFFSSRGNIYWVDARIIEELRPKE